MKLLKTLGLALCLAFLFITHSSKAQVLDPTQVYTTGNIVQPTIPGSNTTPWVNGVYQNSLTCWALGDPGYCGPNAIVRPSGNINFSFGTTNLYQMQAIANVLPDNGTGLRVNGFNFGFMAKNGNGWDNGRQDYLGAYVNFYATNGSLAQGYDYTNYTNNKYNWTAFNFSETFTTPYAAKDLSSVQYGFVGRDNNYWAGPYGPEVYNVNFSLKYSVDPCASNVLSSPSCPGYFEALAKLTPLSTSSTDTITSQTGVITTVEGVAITPTGTHGGTPPPGSQPPLESSQPLSQPSGPAGPAPSGAPVPGPMQQASAQQPAPGGQQPKAGEVSDSSGSSKTTVSLSSILGMISSNQDKTSALEKSVVQAADQQAFAAGETAKQQAEKIAGDAQAQSITGSNISNASTQVTSSQSSFSSMQNSAFSIQSGLQSSASLNSIRTQQAFNNNSFSNSNGVGLTNTNQQSIQYQTQSFKQENNINLSSQPSFNFSLSSRQNNLPIELPASEGIRFGLKTPLDNAMEARPMLSFSNSNNQQNDSVKKNVQDNELAGGISIDSIAKQPANYSQYFFMIPDVAFYAPKEIYRNQRVIDNAATMRALNNRSDRLHEEMVNAQYK